MVLCSDTEYPGNQCLVQCPSTRSRPCTRAWAPCPNSGVGSWKKGVLTLVPIKNGSLAPCSGTKSERSLTVKERTKCFRMHCSDEFFKRCERLKLPAVIRNTATDRNHPIRGEAVFLSNLDKIDTKRHFQTSDIFVNKILLIWAEINFSNNISSLQHYKTQHLWNNSLIRIDCKPVYFREWLAKGISTVDSLLKDETYFLSYTEFLNKYHCKSCPLAFSEIITTLKTIKSFKENIDSLETVEAESFTKAFQKKKPSKLTYRNLVATKSAIASQTKCTEIATSMRKK